MGPMRFAIRRPVVLAALVGGLIVVLVAVLLWRNNAASDSSDRSASDASQQSSTRPTAESMPTPRDVDSSGVSLSPTRSLPAEEDLPHHTIDPAEPSDGMLLFGRLRWDGSCVYLDTDGTKVSLLWPIGFSKRLLGAEVEILNPDGVVVARSASATTRFGGNYGTATRALYGSCVFPGQRSFQVLQSDDQG